VGTVVDTELARIGQRVRESREEQGLTLQELARRSGVATSTIQKVETTQMIPSVAIVMKIARGLGARVATLLDDDDGGPDLEIVHLRPDERHPVGSPGLLEVERLSGDVTEPELETWRVTLHPGMSSGGDSFQYQGEELVICEEGVVTFSVGQGEYALEAGDTLHFKASLAHAWRNDGEVPARFTVTGTLPQQFRAVMQARVAAGGRLP
jgi:transcriptional regulator with XRE-family HTH domain